MLKTEVLLLKKETLFRKHPLFGVDVLNLQINFSSGINSALLFITCAALKALNTFSHSHPISVYITSTFGFQQKLFFSKWGDFKLINGKQPVQDIVFGSTCNISRGVENVFTLCQICRRVCFAPDSVSHGLENMAPLTRAWLAKLFTPSPFTKKFLFHLSLCIVKNN